jgi:hypothetical protein
VADDPASRWLSFEEAVRYVRDGGGAAFASAPVFGDGNETAEGARVFVLERVDQSGIRLRYVAGPFFSNGLAANEVLGETEIPDRVRELQFLPTTFSEAWLSEQLQVLISRLLRASGTVAPQMPDYLDAPRREPPAEVSIPIQQIGRVRPRRGGDA